MEAKHLNNTQFIQFFKTDVSSNLKLPFVANGIIAWFPSPADDFFRYKHTFK